MKRNKQAGKPRNEEQRRVGRPESVVRREQVTVKVNADYIPLVDEVVAKNKTAFGRRSYCNSDLHNEGLEMVLAKYGVL